MSQVGIQNSWPLLDFAKAHGKMKVTNPLINSNTGEEFRSCAFVSPSGNITLVGFSSNLGELTASEIKARKNDLQVVELESGSFKLCKKGDFSAWDDVDLGI
jgi:hypothetical protein